MLTANDLIIAKLRLSSLSKDDQTERAHADGAGYLLDKLERPRRLSAQQKDCAREAVMHLRQFKYSRQWFRDGLGINGVALRRKKKWALPLCVARLCLYVCYSFTLLFFTFLHFSLLFFKYFFWGL